MASISKSTPNSTYTFKGNKSYLPAKLCSHCGRVMTWRKAWAKNWQQIKYCSQACRSQAKREA